jgi:preprotein translocase subunit SecA
MKLLLITQIVDKNGVIGQVKTVVSGQEKVGRNDTCPCGSGKKYKNCHGQGTDQKI